MIRVQKEKRCKNGLITYAAKFNEVTSLKNKSFRLKIWNKDTPLEEIDEYINRCNSDRQFFFQEIHKRYGSFDRGDSYTMLVDSCDEEKTNLNLATLPLRKLWETLELDKFFQKLKFKHNKICEQLKSKETLTDEDKAYTKCTYNLDLAIFLQIADRIINPSSRLETFKNRNSHIIDFSSITLDNIFNSLDILCLHHDSIMKHLNKVATKYLNRQLDTAYYDVTTFYFQSFDEDELRKKGGSKDHKFAENQVLLGILIDKYGLPIASNLYAGNTAEVNTIVSIVNKAMLYNNNQQFTLVADAGLNQFKNLYYLTQNNLNWLVTDTPKRSLNKGEKLLYLKEEGWQSHKTRDNIYKIKSLGELTKKGKIDNEEESKEIKGYYYCTYSHNRYLHDIEEIHKNQEKALKLLDKNLPPSALQSKAGGKTYVSLEGNSKVTFNESKVENDKQWAGYSGFFSNLSSIDPMQQFSILRHLHVIENNFRTLKTTFKTRPMYVRTNRHVRGHTLSCIISLFLLRALELKLKNEDINSTEGDIIKALKTTEIFKVTNVNSNSPEFYTLKLWKGNGELSTLKAHKGEKIEYSDFHNYIPFFKICSVLGLKNLPLRFSRIELLETISIRCKHLLGVTH